MSKSSKFGYDPVAQSATRAPSSDLGDDERAAFLATKNSLARRTPSTRTLLLAALFNFIIFIISLALFGSWYYQNHWVLNAKMRQVSSYSPLHDLVDLGTHVEKINGTLFPRRDQPSIARQMPNPEADALWKEFETIRVFPVTAAQIRAMGKDPTTAAKLEDKDWGLGDDAYVSVLDVYHQLHCLNSLRKLAYPESYDENTRHMSQTKGMRDIHVNHCVDILMQALQCSGNLNLITMHWVETQSHPFPDMSINRQCIDFERLTEWRKENTVDMHKYVKTMKNPAGVNQLKAPDGYYKHYEPDQPNPNHPNGANPGEDFNL